MRLHFREICLWGIILICSSKAAGQSCRGLCGDILMECSCHVTCVSLKNCCVDYNQWCFQVTPYSSSMLGGKPLRIVSLVLLHSEHLTCRFKGEIVREGVIDAEQHAFCISPLLYETGWIKIDVSIDGTHFDRSGEYLSVHPSKADPASEVVLVNATQWHYYGTRGITGHLKMTWNSLLIGAEMVHIELWGYKEINTVAAETNGTFLCEASISYLYSICRNLPNAGSFSFLPEPSQDYSDIELGNIRVTASSVSDGARDVEALWSRGHVLAWHLEQAFRDDSTVWANNKCLQWDVLEKTLPNFLDELSDCPCTLAQARADTGRFHTDYSCNIEKGSVCTYHPGCVHCVRAIQASPTHGSGQQCCYDSSGDLVLTGDSTGGSTPDRAHDWGSPPYGRPPRVPGYSHWLYDVMSFYYCCLWSDHCHIYFKHRPSSGCCNYQPPQAAVVLGDPHFITFDGLSYTFNGKGEYNLVSSSHKRLFIQARTEEVKLKNKGSLAKATRLSSVAMKEESSDIVEVRQTEGYLQVLRNKKVQPLNEQTWMDLHEFTNHTKGLLGLMNSDPSDDLMTQSGEVISSSDSTHEKIFTFGEGWKISKMSSLFTYDSTSLLENYNSPPVDRPAFVPAFSLPENPDDPLVTNTLTMCSGEGVQFCKYDTLSTRSLAVGNSTLRAFHNHLALVKGLEPVVSCGWLPTPRNGQKNGTRYLKGDKLGFSCNEGYALYGSSELTCLDDGTWTGKQPYCITDDPLAYILGVIGVVSALVTMGVMIHLHNRKQHRERKAQQDQTEAQELPH